MKKLILVLGLAAILSGCAAQQTFETVQDVYAAPAALHQLRLTLPDEAALFVMEDGSGSCFYECDGYTLTTQTLAGGELDQTLRLLTGYGADGLTVITTSRDGLRRYDGVWTAAGEGGDQVGRFTVLDDGTNHYAVTVMAEANAAGDLDDTWDALLGSACLVSTD